LVPWDATAGLAGIGGRAAGTGGREAVTGGSVAGTGGSVDGGSVEGGSVEGGSAAATWAAAHEATRLFSSNSDGSLYGFQPDNGRKAGN